MREIAWRIERERGSPAMRMPTVVKAPEVPHHTATAPSLHALQRAFGNDRLAHMLSGRAQGQTPEGEDRLVPWVEDAIRLARGGGRALDPESRHSLERAFGSDFRRVRIHTDGRADELSRALGARAFTTGSDIFFRAGAYAPGVPAGRELLTHELTHVVQQAEAGDGGPNHWVMGRPDDAWEREADRVARQVTAIPPEVSVDAIRPTGTPAPRLQRQSDGSGSHGAWHPWAGDYATKQLWYRVADGAESMGLTNAARHMRHYLNNTGVPLTVDADAMLRDLPELRQHFEDELKAARAAANARVAAGSMSFSHTGLRKSMYARRSASADWFFAIGGFTYWYTAEITVTPSPPAGGAPTLTMCFRLHVFDRYNWDQGKAVNIGPFHVSDESLGRLHRVGLAREFEVHGVTREVTVRWIHPGTTVTPVPLPVAEVREGGRTDPRRERASDRRQDRELRAGPR